MFGEQNVFRSAGACGCLEHEGRPVVSREVGFLVLRGLRNPQTRRTVRQCSKNVGTVGAKQTEMHIRGSTEIAKIVRERLWGLAFQNLGRLASLQGHHGLANCLKRCCSEADRVESTENRMAQFTMSIAPQNQRKIFQKSLGIRVSRRWTDPRQRARRCNQYCECREFAPSRREESPIFCAGCSRARQYCDQTETSRGLKPAWRVLFCERFVHCSARTGTAGRIRR